ncbi:hypothetical protein K0T92_11525 [Paenibacillus oenotherae]|uniref:Uncharacterized protein n=1 Tax=Paenibacillus oenotherae TaxID=1435645 RepID=A0ABS7D675_9BACL|nr:hypothetical protein [Paenibacillus oenotherae]MBW7475380.1 hypothetical protein [Paenibacillus oenotherae]
MEERFAELTELVRKQSNQILEMQQKINILEDKILRLSICKVSNGNYPYYDFILSYGITPDQQSRINRLFMALSNKLAGNTLPTGLREESYSTDFLFSDKPINWDDVKCSITRIWPVTDADLPLSLIKAMKDQGLQIQVCDYLLSQA